MIWEITVCFESVTQGYPASQIQARSGIML